MDPRHASPASRAARVAACLLPWLAGAALAQPLPLDVEIPELLVRACPDARDAAIEAVLAGAIGQQPAFHGTSFDAGRNAACHSLFVAVVPLRVEAGIDPFPAWTIGYSPGSGSLVQVRGGDPIPVAMVKKTVRYYVARITSASGKTAQWWVELADEPYVVEAKRAGK